MITTILLAWKRPEEVNIICEHLNKSELIDEIIVWNNNPDEPLTNTLEKVKVINCSYDFGLFTRFTAASLAKNECILFHDDDLLVPETTLKYIYKEWLQNKYVCHSIFGRNSKNGTYSPKNAYGPVDIILTRFVLTSKYISNYALSKTPEFSDIPGVPVGNGEDIILSFAALKYSNRLNKSYHLEYTNLVENDENAISTRYKDHFQHRSAIIKRCLTVYNISPHLLLLRNISNLYQRIKNKTERMKHKYIYV